MSKNKLVIWALGFAILQGCSSTKKGYTNDHGVLNFFSSTVGEKGLVLRNMQWDKTLSSENPGADCSLKRKPGTPSFSCVVREKNDAVVLTIHEEGEGEARHLKKITLDGKGEEQRDFWVKGLERYGYNKEASKKSDRDWYVSPDQKTAVQVVWAGGAKAVTLIFGKNSRPAPRNPSSIGAKAPAKKGKNRAKFKH